MRRRDLLGAMAAWGMVSACGAGEEGERLQEVNRNVDRDGRWFHKPPQELLFTDLRHWGASHPHKYPRWPGVITSKAGWASWPKGRLVALAADQEGQFHTFGIPVTGAELRINARVRPGGQIRVGIHGAAERSTADCDPIVGDHPAHLATWRGDARLRVALGVPVRLHFQLRAAELFGIQWS